MKLLGNMSEWSEFDYSDYETLFIERDGIVIACSEAGKAATRVSEIKILPEFLKVAPLLAEKFRYIILFSKIPSDVATKPTKAQIEDIDEFIKKSVAEAGGRIDACYCEENVPEQDDALCPGPRIALMARRDFPAINFMHSLMIGNSPSDKRLAFNCGMKYISVGDESEHVEIDSDDEQGIQQELAILHNCVVHNIEVLNKLMNSTVRMHGIRLASRCFCHTIACGHKIIAVLGKDCGFNPVHFADYLKNVVPGTSPSQFMIVIDQNGEDPVADQIAKCAHPGDAVILITAKPNYRDMVRGLEEAMSRGLVTVSLSGAKPGELDNSDVVIKVPSLMIAHIQGAFKMIIAVIHVLVSADLKTIKLS